MTNYRSLLNGAGGKLMFRGKTHVSEDSTIFSDVYCSVSGV